MSRAKKILIAGLVLAAGLGLAWPYRKTDQQAQSLKPVGVRPDLVGVKVSGQGFTTRGHDGPASHVVAKMASTAESATSPSRLPSSATNFDLANHPAIANQTTAATGRPGAPVGDRPLSIGPKTPTSRPAYSTAEDAPTVTGKAEQPTEIVHIVRSTDTLEKLAERYLDDAGRALEIFDLNRDQLSNPYLLPIGAELRIPVKSGKVLD